MDLLVDDKYTGKIAYRVAQAKAADIDRFAFACCGGMCCLRSCYCPEHAAVMP